MQLKALWRFPNSPSSSSFLLLYISLYWLILQFEVDNMRWLTSSPQEEAEVIVIIGLDSRAADCPSLGQYHRSTGQRSCGGILRSGFKAVMSVWRALIRFASECQDFPDNANSWRFMTSSHVVWCCWSCWCRHWIWRGEGEEGGGVRGGGGGHLSALLIFSISLYVLLSLSLLWSFETIIVTLDYRWMCACWNGRCRLSLRLAFFLEYWI